MFPHRHGRLFPASNGELAVAAPLGLFRFSIIQLTGHGLDRVFKPCEAFANPESFSVVGVKLPLRYRILGSLEGIAYAIRDSFG